MICTNFLCTNEATLVDITFDEDLCAECAAHRVELFTACRIRPLEAVRAAEGDRANRG